MKIVFVSILFLVGCGTTQTAADADDEQAAVDDKAVRPTVAQGSNVEQPVMSDDPHGAFDGLVDDDDDDGASGDEGLAND